MSYRSGEPVFIQHIRSGNYQAIQSAPTPSKSVIETYNPLKLAVRLYLNNFTTSSQNRWRLTLIEVVEKIKKTSASVFPHDDNALHQLVRSARSQQQYDAVASVFREHAPRHFTMAHAKQYMNNEMQNERLVGQMRRASSFLLARGINASQNRPKTHRRSPLGPSTIRANLGNNNAIRPMRVNARSARSVNNLSNRLGGVNLEAIVSRAVDKAFNRRSGSVQSRTVQSPPSQSFSGTSSPTSSRSTVVSNLEKQIRQLRKELKSTQRKVGIENDKRRKTSRRT